MYQLFCCQLLIAYVIINDEILQNNLITKSELLHSIAYDLLHKNT